MERQKVYNIILPKDYEIPEEWDFVNNDDETKTVSIIATGEEAIKQMDDLLNSFINYSDN